MKLTKQQEAEVMPIYKEWWQSYMNGDVKTYDHYLDDDYRFVGSTEAEDFLNKRDTTQFFGATADQLAGKSQLKNRKITAEYFDGIVFITELADAYLLFNDEWTYYGKFRFSSMLKQKSEGWRFIYQHFSVPDAKAQEGETIGLEQVTKENQELRDAIKRRTIELENKNRELKIEAGLERVRAQSLAMHYTSEIQTVIHTVHEELLRLDLSIVGGSFVVINKDVDTKLRAWAAGATADTTSEVIIPDFGEPFTTNLINGIRKGPGFFTEEFTREEKIEYFTALFNEDPWSELSNEKKKEVLESPGGYTRSCCVLKHTSILVINQNGRIFSAEENDILKRFTKVFEQSYIRFLDLQKAEAQAREAEIELALEKVRARTMAMQKSEELAEVSSLMFKQLKILKIKTYSSGFTIWDNENDELISWMCNADGSLNPPFRMPLKKDTWHKEQYEGWKKGEEFMIKDFSGEKMRTHFKYLRSFPLLDEAFKKSIAAGHPMPERQVHHTVNFSHGNLLFISLAPIPEAHDIFKRFAKVFEQTYTRFLDLQKAEAQAREAEIELALERVRAKTMAMQKSDELVDASDVMFNELKRIEANAIRIGICIIDGTTGSSEIWSRSEINNRIENKILGVVPAGSHPVFDNMVKAWKENKSFFSCERVGNEVKEYYDQLRLHLSYPEPKQYNQRETLTSFFFSEGAINVVSLEPLDEEVVDVMKRFARVFGQLYTRFLDLQKAEAQARETQVELALERIRARTMAMQNSVELTEASVVLDEQVRALGIQTWGSAFHIYADDPEGDYEWFSSREGTLPFYKTPREGFFLKFYNKGKSGEKFHVEEFLGEECKVHYDYLMTLPVIGDALREILASGGSLPDSQYDHIAFFKYGYVLFITYEPVPESYDIFKRFAKVFEQTYTRFLDLKNAEAQSRESQIELALERVRARTMAMQNSGELADVAFVLFEQLRGLGGNLWGTGFGLCDKNNERDSFWFANENGVFPPVSIPNTTDPAHQQMFQGWEAGKYFLAMEASGEDLESHYDYMLSLPEVKPFFQKILDEGLSFPKWQQWNAAYFKHGYLLIITLEPYPDRDILLRFARVFEQTYTRFLDLEKAEKQAREARIETALEKVRSRSLAMHKSDELNKVVKLLFEKMTELEVPSTAIGIQTFTEDSKDMQCFVCGDVGSGIVISQYRLPYFDHPIIEDYHEAHEKDLEFYVGTYSKKEKDSFYDVVLKLPELKGLPAEVNTMIRESSFYEITMVPAKKSVMSVNDFHGNPLSQIQVNILKRFSKVFDQAYTRFLDLQNVEEKAREAQIEAALERVRSRSMGMQKSSDLHSVVDTIYEELKRLELVFHAVVIQLQLDDTKDMHMWINSGDEAYDDIIHWPYVDIPMFNAFYEARIGSKTFHYRTSGEAETKEFFEEYFKLETVSKKRKNFLKNVSLIDNIGTCQNHTGVFLMRYSEGEFSEKDRDIVRRFSKVFEQTYTRFLDLQKAEEQARESQIQLALERVRARTMAMQKSDELAETSVEVFKQLIELGIEPNRLFIGVIKGSHEIETWATNEDGTKIASRFVLDTKKNDSIREMYQGWKQKKQSITIDMKGPVLKDYFHYLAEEKKIPFKGGLSQKRRIQYIAFFSKGFIGMASPGEQPKETLELLERFAAVFNLTFTRFNDLKIAEANALKAEQDLIEIKAARKKAESALSDLQATQKQLVQSEKMASLGELTAGIAHEIKNPLNFVNNFSEVSKELLAEVDQELANGDLEIVREILGDVNQNLEKIIHHGKRADGIVKGMLQHSRSHSGKKEIIKLNNFVDEYLRLAYHGLRARDKSFNAKMETQFSEEVGSIDAVPQELGRVILNLVTNAFYAVNEKKTLRQAQGKVRQVKDDNSYEPTVWVSTIRKKGVIEIKVRDNGIGIPKEIKDKIFQPFFSTKPTGQGTGLGLSLSYDIVKAHGGEITVKSKENKGTEFTIKIPH